MNRYVRKVEVNEDQREVVEAIILELIETPKFIIFEILSQRQIGQNWQIELKEKNKYKLEESYEEASCWWHGSSNNEGKAEILSVDVENNKINIRFATAEPPGINNEITIYPPRYLQKILDLWKNKARAKKFLKNTSFKDNSFLEDDILDTSLFKELRSKQESAFRLLGWQKSFLWGPPGTGKTYTLGALIAQYICQNRYNKILLLSTTNNAVDLSLVAIDKSLERFKDFSLRKKCKRVGNRYNAINYENRENLIPTVDKELLDELIELEKSEPDKADVNNYSIWKLECEKLRKRSKASLIRNIKNNSLIAMTTTYATFFYDTLDDFPFDLIVFDEVSQVSLAHTLAISYLGKKVLYIGDSKQLSPIVMSNERRVKKWLNRSIFDLVSYREEFFCTLNEQSRMSKEICSVVSKIFYRNILKVALKESSNEEWNNYRKLNAIPLIQSRAFKILKAQDDGKWSQKYKGFIRYETATLIADLVEKLASEQEQKTILVLTVFHAQRILIKQKLRKKGLKKVNVFTVHKSQGTERHTVLFDPVAGGESFFAKDERFSSQLTNVAISRSEARFITFFSEGDLNNKIYNKIYKMYLEMGLDKN